MEDKDRRPFFVLTNEYPRHRKIRGLSDKAFRLHVTLMGLCNEDRNDGIISRADLDMLGTKPGKELIDKQLIHATNDGQYQLHDYLKHQNSRTEIEALIADKQAAGRRGGTKSAHKRWHLDRNIIDPNCELCPTINQ